MKNFQKRSLAIISLIVTNTCLSAGVQLEIHQGVASFAIPLQESVQKVGGGSLSLAVPNPDLKVLDINAGNVMVAGTSNLGASTSVLFSGDGVKLKGGGDLAVHSLALSAAGALENSGATTIQSATLGGNVLTTHSAGGTTIALLTPDASGSINNDDALTLAGAAPVAQPITISGIGPVAITGALNSTGGFVSGTGAVTLGAAGQLPTGANAIAGSLSLASSGAAAAIRSNTVIGGSSAQLNIPATVTPGSITGEVTISCGTVVKPVGSVDAGILGAGGSFKVCPGSKILVVDGSTWSVPVTFMPVTALSAAPVTFMTATPPSAAPVGIASAAPTKKGSSAPASAPVSGK
jgi:hypothetical protein